MSKPRDKRFVGSSGVAVLGVALVLALFACAALAATPEGDVLAASEAASKDELEKRDKKDAPPGQTTRGCNIGKAKFESGALNPANECQSCQASVDRFAWTDRVDGATCSAGVCVDAACCTPMPVDECGPAQCGLVDDGCGGFTDCGACLEARDDLIEFTEPLAANGLTVYPLSPLDNDRMIDADAAQIVSVTQAVFDRCAQPTEFVAFHIGWEGPCWRQLGVISIDPGGKRLELNLNPGTAPWWNPRWPYFTKESSWAPDEGRSISHRSQDCKDRKGTVEPDNVDTTGTAVNPALLCIASNEQDVFLAKVPNPPGGDFYELCNVQPEPWDIPFEYTVSDGVHQSTATVTLNMYTPGCQPLPSYAFDPNALLIQSLRVPPIAPNLVNHTLLVATMTEDSPAPADGLPPIPEVSANSPTITLDSPSAPLTVGPVVIKGSLDATGAVVPATCPAVPGVEFSSCDAVGSFSTSPDAPFLTDPTGALVRLSEPLSLSGLSSQRAFLSVQIYWEGEECEGCPPPRGFLASLVNVEGRCYRSIGGEQTMVWCANGEVCPTTILSDNVFQFGTQERCCTPFPTVPCSG